MTLPRNLEVLTGTAHEIALLDYNCPQRSADWAAQSGGQNLRVLRLKGGSNFYNSPRAKQIAHLESDGDIVCNLDADNLITPQLVEFLMAHCTQESFCRAATQGAGGMVGMTRARFMELGGYDQRMGDGWGFDDTDLSERAIALGLRLHIIPSEYYAVLPHDDELRTRHMQSHDKFVSNHRHRMMSAQNVALGQIHLRQQMQYVVEELIAPLYR